MSVVDAAGANLFDAGHDAFPFAVAAAAAALRDHGDLLAAACACAGNDARLGGDEAPPAVVSLHLGDALFAHLDDVFVRTAPNSPNAARARPPAFEAPSRVVDFGVAGLPRCAGVAAEPRNRSAPVVYVGGNRLELRTPGASQNCALAVALFAAALAEAFDEVAAAVARGARPLDAAAALWARGRDAVYGGSCYSAKWRAEAAARGLASAPSGVDAVERAFARPGAAAVLARVFPEDGAADRWRRTLHDAYAVAVELEARVAAAMVARVLPALRAGGHDAAPLERAAADLAAAADAIEGDDSDDDDGDRGGGGDRVVAIRVDDGEAERTPEPRRGDEAFLAARRCLDIRRGPMARVAALSADAEAKLGTAWPFPTAFELVFSSAADPSDPG